MRSKEAPEDDGMTAGQAFKMLRQGKRLDKKRRPLKDGDRQIRISVKKGKSRQGSEVGS